MMFQWVCMVARNRTLGTWGCRIWSIVLLVFPYEFIPPLIGESVKLRKLVSSVKKV